MRLSLGPHLSAQPHIMKLLRLLPALVMPLAAFGQTSVFNTTFDSGSNALNSSTFDISATGSTWNVASPKSASANLASGLTMSLPSTSSGFVEAQTRFATTPITLSSAGDYVKVVTTFTGTNVLSGSGVNTGAQLFIGLFDSGGSNPANGLMSSGLSTTSGSSYATGGTQLWDGYNARVSYTGGTSVIGTRPQQTGAGTTSANQELLFQGGGGQYANPAGTNLITSNVASATAAITAGDTYTLAYTITLTDVNTYSIGYELFAGSDTSGSAFSSLTVNNVTGTTYLTDSFDGLAMGYRYIGTAATSSITYSSLEVLTNTVSAIPEPSTYALGAGALALAFVGWQRRARRQLA